MTPNRPITIAATIAALTVSAGLAACGSSTSSSATAAATAPTAPASTAPATAAAAAPATTAVDGKITVDASEYAFMPAAVTAKPGKLSFTLDNKGKIPHELIVLKTSADPAGLKVDPSTARISESSSVGEVSETAAGKAKTSTLDLAAGTYVYVCNIPAHYGLGMYGVLEVK